MRLLFATGGTGGHIYPALAIAKAAQVRGYEVAFIGQAEGMEAQVIPQAGFTFYGVGAGKWDRQRPNPLQGVRAANGLVQAVRTVRRVNPALVVGFGGFASFPGIAAARLTGTPYLLHEGNAYPGRVTHLFAGGAKVVAVSHEAARARLKRARQVEVTGFPVREVRVENLEARRRLGLPTEGVLTFVMGGSQGSKVLNETVPKVFEEVGGTIVLHSTGRRWLEVVRGGTAQLEGYYTEGFVDASLAWSAADLAITRAGFGTLAEAAFHGVPTLMVPLPTAAENHQLHNARAFAAAGAGWVVEERELENLAEVWMHALTEEVRRQASTTALALSPVGAATTFVDLIDKMLPQTKAARLESA